MPRLERKLSDWRVFIDGVEVPHQGFTITCGRNSYATGQLYLEPDKVVHEFRPNSLIHFFFWDSTDPRQDELDKYKLYMEVELLGPGHSKTPQHRSMAVHFAGLFRIFSRHRMFMSSIGQSFQTPYITGGYAIPSIAQGVSGRGDSFSFLALAKSFDPDNAGTPGDKAPFRTNPDSNFAERLLPLIAYLSSYNGSQRLSVIRSRLLNKIAAVPDSTIGGMIPATLSNLAFQQLKGQIRADHTYLDLFTHFCGQAFHSWYQVPTPYYAPRDKKLKIPDAQTGQLVEFPAQPGDKGNILKMPQIKEADLDIFSFVRDYYRNDYILAPELFYAMPPPCNFIMPEDIDQLSYQRTYDNEPTRVILNEKYFSQGKAAYFAPSTILRSMPEQDRSRVTAAEFFSSNLNGLGQATTAGSSNSPYQAAPHVNNKTAGSVNLLSVLSEDEIEKGIICRRDTNPFELFTAVARYFDDKEDLTQAFASEKNRAERINQKGLSDYERIMTTLADYRYQLGKAERNASVSCRGLRWIAPGFSTMIFDNDSSYLAFVESTTLTVDIATGNETTNVGLSRVRTIPRVTKKEAEKLDKKFQKERDSRSSQYGEISGKYQAKITAVEGHIREFEKAMRNVSGYVTSLDLLSRREVSSAGFTPETKLLALKIRAFGGDVTVPAATLAPLQAAATSLNSMATPIRSALYGGQRSETAERFYQDENLTTKASLPGKATETRTKSITVFSEERGTYKYTKTFTTRERYERGDYTSYAGMDFPVFLDAQLDPSVFVVSDDAQTVTLTREILKTMKVQGEQLGRQILSFLRAQEKALQTASDEGTVADVDTLGDNAIATAVKAAELNEDYVRSYFSELTGFQLPPTWFNKGFLLTRTIDKIYQALLGTQPFYGSDTEFGKDLQGADPSSELTAKTLYDEYGNFLRIVDRLFPILDDDSGISPRRTGGSTKWEELSQQPETEIGPGPWVDQNVQSRVATSLRQFLDMHALKLEKQMSDQPTPEEFWLMVPRNPQDENTIFDFIVDEWEMFPELKDSLVSAPNQLQQLFRQGLGSLGIDVPDVSASPGDPIVQQLRAEAKQSDHPSARYLFRSARQEIILNYSKRHFGPRAFDGR